MQPKSLSKKVESNWASSFVVILDIEFDFTPALDIAIYLYNRSLVATELLLQGLISESRLDKGVGICSSICSKYIAIASYRGCWRIYALPQVYLSTRSYYRKGVLPNEGDLKFWQLSHNWFQILFSIGEGWLEMRQTFEKNAQYPHDEYHPHRNRKNLRKVLDFSNKHHQLHTVWINLFCLKNSEFQCVVDAIYYKIQYKLYLYNVMILLVPIFWTSMPIEIIIQSSLVKMSWKISIFQVIAVCCFICL